MGASTDSWTSLLHCASPTLPSMYCVPVSASLWVHPNSCTTQLYTAPRLCILHCVAYSLSSTQVLPLSLYLYWCIQNTMLHHIKSAALYKGTTMLLAAAPFTCSVYYTTHSVKICYALYKDILYSWKVEMSWEPDGGKGDALTLPTGLSILM